jgi:omega-amidase
MNIVIVQLDIAWEDKPANHQRVRELLAAETIPADSIIILPEMFDTGCSMQLDKTAQSQSRESERFLRELAAEYQSVTLGGVVGPIDDGMASNEAVAFDPGGTELVRYRKRKPFSKAGETACHRAGSQVAGFHWQGVQIAPLICYDLRFPELFREAVRAGAELFIVIACWPSVRSEHWYRLLQARAIENLALVVGVNRCGAEPGLVFDGRSCVFDEQGRSLFQADDREQVYQLELDPLTMRTWRAEFPPLRDMHG